MNYDLDPTDGDFEESGQDITALLDIGYRQLDGFVSWCETKLGMDTRSTQQDCFNAEFLMDYLANRYRKPVGELNEFELRWFVFSHYIRKAMADVQTEERLLISLGRFFGYLDGEGDLNRTAWMLDILDEGAYYNKRRAAYKALSEDDEREWKIGFQDWCAELEDDLDSRCLLLPRDLGDGMTWSDAMGWREATLHDEANEMWQRERDQLLTEGIDLEHARDQLKISYLDWVDSPQSRLDDRSPAEIIQTERLEAPESLEHDVEDEAM